MTSASEKPRPDYGVAIKWQQVILPTDRRDATYMVGVVPTSDIPDQVAAPSLLIGLAQKLVRGLAWDRLNVAIGPAQRATPHKIQLYRFRDRSLSVELNLLTGPVPGPRPGLLAALTAREAAIDGRDRAVDDFAVAWLGMPPKHAPQWREAVSTALLTDWAEALRQPHTADDSVLRLLKRETLAEHRRLQPLWERKTAGHRWQSLDKPIGTGVTLGDLVVDGSSAEDAVLRSLLSDGHVAAVLRQLHADETCVAQEWAESGETWRQAAVAAGLPAAYGERVRRKLKRLGRDARRAAQPTRTDDH
ncbi:hypothetical protein ACWDO7_00635 [Streptomyces sp. NPDC003656]